MNVIRDGDGMPKEYKVLCDEAVDLTKLGFGEHLIIAYDPEECALWIAVSGDPSYNLQACRRLNLKKFLEMEEG